MLGPKQRLLASYVTNANDEPLDTAGQQWTTGEGLLRRVATQLQARSTEIGTDERFSGESAKAASQAFAHSAKKMADRADEMRDGAGAFHQAAIAVRKAKTANQQFTKHAGDQPPQQPSDLTDVKAQRDWKTQNNQFWNNYGDSETAAGDAITALSENHTTQAAVFAKIHGETPPPPPPGHNSNNPLTTRPLRRRPRTCRLGATPATTTTTTPAATTRATTTRATTTPETTTTGTTTRATTTPVSTTTRGSPRVRPRTRQRPSRVVRFQATSAVEWVAVSARSVGSGRWPEVPSAAWLRPGSRPVASTA